MKRAGLSRAVVEVILVVMVTFFVLMMFTPLGGYILGSYAKTSSLTGSTRIEIIGVDPSRPICTETSTEWPCNDPALRSYLLDRPAMWIYVMNVGPKDLTGIGGPGAESKWLIVIENSTGRYAAQHYLVAAWYDSGNYYDFNHVEIWVLWSLELANPKTISIKVEVSGPEGTQANYLYSP